VTLRIHAPGILSAMAIFRQSLVRRGDPDHRFVRAVAYTLAMISRTDVAIIRAEIERLQKARDKCTDSGVLKQIDAWIEEQKQKLVAQDSSEGTDSQSAHRQGRNKSSPSQSKEGRTQR
jgi:hypothetical protein